jgi:hypothetical protein
MVTMRVVVPTVVVAVLTSGVAIMVNIATGGNAGWWAWLTVAVLTLLTAVASLWLHTASHDEPPRPPVSTPPAPFVPPTPVVQQNAISSGGSVQQAAGDIVNIETVEGGGAR